MESSNDKKKPGADHEAPSPERMTAEQIAGDMKRYARQHPYHGELHALDDQEAVQAWEQRRKEEVPVGFALERPGAVDGSRKRCMPSFSIRSGLGGNTAQRTLTRTARGSASTAGPISARNAFGPC